MPVTHYIGLMSGTSLDGVDASLVLFSSDGQPCTIGSYHVAFPEEMRQQLLALNSPGTDEINHSALLANQLAELYADATLSLLQSHHLSPTDITAVGCHGQTIRHRPELGYTIQIGNSALLAERIRIPVISDFRSRDIAAGGQGAPLVPAFHQAVFSHPAIHRVIVNIGGISNLTDLPPRGPVQGFDCGPGNVLMDGWIQRHQSVSYDRDGAWAARGAVISHLLEKMLAHPFLFLPPPKSTGRDTFHAAWLETLLDPEDAAADVQATLLEFTARCITTAIATHCADASEVYLCGGGARNQALVSRLRDLLSPRQVILTDALGLGVEQVESAAFAWLARQTIMHLPGNLPAVTGAAGPRLLGAIYPA